MTEAFAACPESQDRRSGCAESAVAGDVFRKWRSRKGAWLIRNPLRSIHCYGSLPGTAPRANLLVAEEKRDGRNWTHGIECTLGVPRGDARIEDCVRQCEEHLHVLIH